MAMANNPADGSNDASAAVLDPLAARRSGTPSPPHNPVVKDTARNRVTRCPNGLSYINSEDVTEDAGGGVVAGVGRGSPCFVGALRLVSSSSALLPEAVAIVLRPEEDRDT